MISVSAFIPDGNSEQQKTGNLGPRRLYTTSDWGRAGDDSNLMGGEYVSSSKRSGCFALSRWYNWSRVDQFCLRRGNVFREGAKAQSERWLVAYR